ncbi:MAG: DUF4386 family protein [Verrucomicrobia bacterium]|nr:DUF4386 family protein [Leptolyngbya sp. ES-bin-22]
MNNFQKIGGIAALINGAAYVVGFGMAFTLLAPIIDSDADTFVAFLANNQTLMFIWHLIIYLVAGVFMVPLVLALHERLKSNAPAMMQIATAFGIIWAGLIIASGMLLVTDAGVVSDLYVTDPAQAKTVWLALSSVETALGGTPELPGGLWALLVSWIALQVGGLPRALNYLGLVIGVAGIVSVVPALAELAGTIFGLGFVVWFVWAGIVMVRTRSSAA